MQLRYMVNGPPNTGFRFSALSLLCASVFQYCALALAGQLNAVIRFYFPSPKVVLAINLRPSTKVAQNEFDGCRPRQPALDAGVCNLFARHERLEAAGRGFAA